MTRPLWAPSRGHSEMTQQRQLRPARISPSPSSICHLDQGGQEKPSLVAASGPAGRSPDESTFVSWSRDTLECANALYILSTSQLPCQLQTASWCHGLFPSSSTTCSCSQTLKRRWSNSGAPVRSIMAKRQGIVTAAPRQAILMRARSRRESRFSRSLVDLCLVEPKNLQCSGQAVCLTEIPHLLPGQVPPVRGLPALE